MQGRKLTPDETTKRLVFIGECVEANAILPTSLRFGQTSNLTVQDLCNSSVDTLKRVGEGLEKIQAKSGTSRFGNEKEADVSGFPVSRWIDFVELTAIKKLNEVNEARKQTEIKNLQRELENLETPQERKEKLTRRLAELTGEPTAQPEVVATT